jgi:hypothetical protein
VGISDTSPIFLFATINKAVDPVNIDTMPKRKRTYEDKESFQNDSANSPRRALEVQKKQVEQHVTIGKKALNKALKLAKGFERQKLGRRLKEAKTKNDPADISRLECEIEVLKVCSFSHRGIQ